MGWSENVNIPTYNLDEVIGGNDEYKDKSSSRLRHLFNNKWLSRYPHPQKVMFDDGYEFKRDLTSLLKYFDIEPVLTKKNSQSYSLNLVFHTYKLMTLE